MRNLKIKKNRFYGIVCSEWIRLISDIAEDMNDGVVRYRTISGTGRLCNGICSFIHSLFFLTS